MSDSDCIISTIFFLFLDPTGRPRFFFGGSSVRYSHKNSGTNEKPVSGFLRFLDGIDGAPSLTFLFLGLPGSRGQGGKLRGDIFGRFSSSRIVRSAGLPAVITSSTDKSGKTSGSNGGSISC